MKQTEINPDDSTRFAKANETIRGRSYCFYTVIFNALKRSHGVSVRRGDLRAGNSIETAFVHIFTQHSLAAGGVFDSKRTAGEHNQSENTARRCKRQDNKRDQTNVLSTAGAKM